MNTGIQWRRKVIGRAIGEVLRRRRAITLDADGKARDIPDIDRPELHRLNKLLDDLRTLKRVVV